jgi:hypothetical protein
MASGSPFPFGYEWRRFSATVASNTVNTLANFYTFQAKSFPTSETYRVIVRNLANTGIGANASITVVTVADADNDGIPDAFEAAYGVGGQLDPAGDLDGDTLNNLAEYIAGTDPTNPSSYLKVNGITAGESHSAVQRCLQSDLHGSVHGRIGHRMATADRCGGANQRPSGNHHRPRLTTDRIYRLATPKQP